MRRLDSLLLNDWGIAPDGLPERTTVAGIGFTELIVFADVLHAAANPGHHGLAQFCRSRRITSSEIDTHLLDCIKNFGLSRDPCGIDLIMPLPAPAKGCVASA